MQLPPLSRHPARLLLLAVLLIGGLRGVEAQTAPELPPELKQRLAGHLAQTAAPACAVLPVLADERQGVIDGREAAAAIEWLAWHQQLNAYTRADFVSRELDGRWSDAQHNDYWLRQARELLRREEFPNTEHALRRLREPLAPEQARTRDLLLGRLRLLQQRSADALPALQAVAERRQGDVFERYNLALAMIGDKRSAAQGRRLLDELSQAPVQTAEEIALRDRMLLTLGWSWLAAQKGGTARPFFRRVSLEGPYSNRALLGLGWAELAPNGYRQYATTVMGFFHEFPFEPEVKGAERFRRALKPWQVLTQRGTQDPAVQEALLASAYAQQRLRAWDQAAAAYRHAIQRYEAEVARLRALETALRESSGDPRPLVQRLAQPGEFIEAQASARYARVEDELDILHYCEDELAGSVTHPRDTRTAGHQAIFAGARAAVHDELRRLYLDDLERRRVRLNTYLARALFSLAVLQDRRGS
ncbi:MAG TPA: hypothetical protein VNJ47_13075 [Nevskiales bacterium]|nr:hypothetical protein [Nevskiales bacterium]